MRITEDKGTTVVEVSKAELQKYNLSFGEMDCSSVHTKWGIRRILSDALGERSNLQKEIILLPDTDEGCVIVCKETGHSRINAVSFSTFVSSQSEIFCSFFS